LNLLQAVLLGVIQGVVEWLPISSQGMVTLVSINFLKISAAEAVKFSIWLHLGTLIAATTYFKDDILAILKHIPDYLRNMSATDDRSRLTTFLLISTLITGIVGFPLFLLSIEAFSSLSTKIITFLIGCFLIITGLIQRRTKDGKKEVKDLQRKDGLVLGIVQGFSTLPGISRSGITTSTLLFKKFSPEAALKISFIMSIPAVLAAEVGMDLLNILEISPLSVVSMAFAFATGLLTIGALLKVAKKIDFWKFCIVLGLIAMLPVLI
jgi:undecaprenyl-diphosphatase